MVIITLVESDYRLNPDTNQNLKLLLFQLISKYGKALKATEERVAELKSQQK